MLRAALWAINGTKIKHFNEENGVIRPGRRLQADEAGENPLSGGRHLRRGVLYVSRRLRGLALARSSMCALGALSKFLPLIECRQRKRAKTLRVTRKTKRTAYGGGKVIFGKTPTVDGTACLAAFLKCAAALMSQRQQNHRSISISDNKRNQKVLSRGAITINAYQCQSLARRRKFLALFSRHGVSAETVAV